MPITTTQALIILGATVLATVMTRAFPFLIFGRKGSEPPKVIKYLGDILPPTVIAVLLVYCMKAIDFTQVNTYVPQLICIGIVILLHVWKKNNLLSIGGGTICYMLLIQNVFV